MLASARRQVLVEATIVEVELNDRYQAGVDWSVVAPDAGISLSQSLLAGNLAAPPFFLLGFENDSLGVTARLLREFGKVQVLSSPEARGPEQPDRRCSRQSATSCTSR